MAPRPAVPSALSNAPREKPVPWHRETGVETVIRKWLAARAISECLAANHRIAPTQACSKPLPDDLDPRLVASLRKRGIEELYSHQHEAISATLSGKHVVTATPTASGKSLCLHLPVLNALAQDATANALYLYPTKALSRDQEHGLHLLIREAGLDIPALVFDGDTPGDARRAAREHSRIVLTNPDMLHASILPNHARWARVLQNLQYVVLDELHTYRGVFGSHMAHVIARLKRIARFHGSNPRFIAATATIGNPKEHTARLLGVEPHQVQVVSQSGAPAAERRIFLYNPPIVNAELGIRGSALKHAVRLTIDLLQAAVPTIIFAGSRNSVEVMLKYIRDKCDSNAVPGVGSDTIFGYRGGYLPDKRRSIERGLREGKIRCVVATNALELGIDIGDLDAVICVGYPGSIAATWQRFGRAGRRGSKSVSILVCNSRATDQFMANQPDYVLDAGAEEARIDPSNVEILVQHLKCAAFESPFRVASAATSQPQRYAGLDPQSTLDALDYLAEQGLLHRGSQQYTWTGETSPATHVSLRSVSWDNFVIIDMENEQTLAELDWRSAHTMLHEQAIYQHDAAQYQVERLDFENHKAFVRLVEPDYFTTALTNSRVSVLEMAAERTVAQGQLGYGDIQVTETVTGYKKIKFFTHENTGYGDVHLPDMEMHTTGFWWVLDEGPSLTLLRKHWSRSLLIDALRGAGEALKTMATLSLMCEPQDLARTLASDDAPGGEPECEVEPGEPRDADASYRPSLFLYDAIPGGVGLARRIYERIDELMAKAAVLIENCECPAGCPACVGASQVRSERKAAAAALLRGSLPN